MTGNAEEARGNNQDGVSCMSWTEDKETWWDDEAEESV